MTSCDGGSLVGWSGGGGGGGGKIFLSRKVFLSRRVVFWGFKYKLKLPFKEYGLVLGFYSWHIISASIHTGSSIPIITA